jgi:hypothetical protein
VDGPIAAIRGDCEAIKTETTAMRWMLASLAAVNVGVPLEVPIG